MSDARKVRSARAAPRIARQSRLTATNFLLSRSADQDDGQSLFNQEKLRAERITF
jgi:hypothetical protein